MKRLGPNTIQFDNGEVVPESLCQWTAYGEEWDFSPGDVKRGLARSNKPNWWNTGWARMEPKGVVKNGGCVIIAKEAVIDAYLAGLEPATNEWGDVSP